MFSVVHIVILSVYLQVRVGFQGDLSGESYSKGDMRCGTGSDIFRLVWVGIS
jgi:hypothetical protein